jgi:ERCC4-type nuclease
MSLKYIPWANMEIWVDHRETELKRLMVDSFVFAKQLEIGDIIFSHLQRILVIFERKTVGDLSSSVIDGRYIEQKTRLNVFSTEHNVPIIYILEGCSMMCHNDDRLSENSMSALKMSMLFDRDIKVAYTEDTKHTIEFLKRAFLYMSSKVNSNECSKATMDDIMCMKKNRLITSANLFRLQLSQIPGVSSKLSAIIASTFDNSAVTFFACLAKDGHSAMEQRISALQTRSNRTIGAKTAHKILEYIQ